MEYDENAYRGGNDTCMYACMHACTYVCMNECTHTHTHTHTHRQSVWGTVRMHFKVATNAGARARGGVSSSKV